MNDWRLLQIYRNLTRPSAVRQDSVRIIRNNGQALPVRSEYLATEVRHFQSDPWAFMTARPSKQRLEPVSHSHTNKPVYKRQLLHSNWFSFHNFRWNTTRSPTELEHSFYVSAASNFVSHYTVFGSWTSAYVFLFWILIWAQGEYHPPTNILSGFHLNVPIYTYVCVILGPPLWSSGHSFGYRSRGPGFDSRPYQIFWEVRGQPRENNWGATWMKSRGSGLENRD
jgi:hypothetical protein